MAYFLVWGPALCWVLSEVVGKFLLKKLNKKVLSVLVGVAIAIALNLLGKMGMFQTILTALVLGPGTGILHDKLIEPVLVAGKNEISK